MNNLCYCHSITFKTNFQLNQNINKGSFLTFDRSNKHKCHFLLSKKKILTDQTILLLFTKK